jgi:hypothetical protein
MPVAALIVVGPGIEVKPVKGNPLGADRDHGEERTNLTIEAIFVHAEIRRGIAQPDEARQNVRRRGETARSPWERPRGGGMFDHRRPY